MGSIGDCYDNSMMESFWGTLQLETLDMKTWKTRDELANAIFEWIEYWYNPKRRHSRIGMLSPAEFEATTPSDRHHTTVADTTPDVSGQQATVRSSVIRLTDAARCRVSRAPGRPPSASATAHTPVP
jgi:integrase-like protein